MMKKNNLTRLLLVILSLVLVLGIFAACSPKKPSKGDPGKEDPGKTDPGKDDPQEEPRIEIDLGEHNWNGAEYHVLEWSANGQDQVGQSWIPWAEIDVENDDGDTIGSAIYSRNSSIEEKYGVVISTEYKSVDGGAYINAVRASNQAADNNYQLLTIRTVNMVSLIQEKQTLDLRQYENVLHFDQPWWVADSVTSFALGDHLYVASSELLLRDKGATATMFYNQRLADDKGVANLYELVDNKEWTLDKMLEISEGVTENLEDTDITNDVWGCAGAKDSIYYIYNGFGQKFGHMDEDGYLTMDFGTGDSITIMQEVLELFMYSDAFCNTAINKDLANAFRDGQALFASYYLKKVNSLRSEMEDTYGILPNPLYDESQENYSSLVWIHHDCVLGIPSQVADVEMATVILEALSYESYYTTYPKFYETVLMNRSTRDDDSKRMLQIVFDTRSYDPGQYWTTTSGLHGTNAIMALTDMKSTAIASLWESYRNAVEKDVTEVNEWIDEN